MSPRSHERKLRGRTLAAALATVAVILGGIVGYRQVATGDGGASCTSTISSGIATAVSNASAGAVICLTAGSYGDLTLSNVTKSGTVTVRPIAGATVTLGSYTYSDSSNITLTGSGGTLNLDGGDGDPGGSGSQNMTVSYVNFTGPFNIYQKTSSQTILFDHDIFDNLPAGNFEGRLNVAGGSTQHRVTISNSYFGGGGCSDGVHIDGDYVQVGPGNEFTGLNQGSCAPHVDPIQIDQGNNYTLIIGNYIHDNGNGSGTVANFDGATGTRLENNVLEGSGYPCSACLGACVSCTATHNVFLVNPLDMKSKPEDGAASTVTATDNVFIVSPPVVTSASGFTTGVLTENHNLCLSSSSVCNAGTDVFGTPVFVGGSNPTSFTSYAQYALAPGSPGYHAASDGQSMGITP